MELQISKEHLKKKEIQKLANQQVGALLEAGMITPLEAFVIAHKYEELAKTMKAKLLEHAKEEVDQRGTPCLSTVVREHQSGKYDYSHNEDWVNLQKELKEIEEKMKAAYKAGGSLLDEETGEVHQPAKYNPSKISLKINY